MGRKPINSVPLRERGRLIALVEPTYRGPYNHTVLEFLLTVGIPIASSIALSL